MLIAEGGCICARSSSRCGGGALRFRGFIFPGSLCEDKRCLPHQYKIDNKHAIARVKTNNFDDIVS
jgi:hypothetical protein